MPRLKILIKYPKGSETIYYFCSVPSSFCAQNCRDEFSVTIGRIVLKSGDIIDIDMKLCKRVSKFKMSNFMAGLRACSQTAKILSGLFLSMF